MTSPIIKPPLVTFPYPRYVIEDGLLEADALISINSPCPKPWETPLPYSSFKDVLRLEFDDVPVVRFERDGVIYSGPTKEDLLSSLAFAERVIARGGEFVAVHCTAGKSRSAAISLAILASHLGGGNEELAVKTLLLHDRDQQMCFNPLLIRYADEILTGATPGPLEQALILHCPAFRGWKKYWDRQLAV